jgi:hypothetical protein
MSISLIDVIVKKKDTWREMAQRTRRHHEASKTGQESHGDD